MSLLKSKNKKSILIIAIISLLLITGLLGGKWQQAYATTTIPLVDWIDPSVVLKNYPDTTFTIYGADFIGEWGVEWTRVRWRGSDGQDLTVTPISVSDDGTEIVFVLPWYLFSHQGIGEVVVINHPEDPDLIEISDVLYVNIIDFLYLPFLAK